MVWFIPQWRLASPPEVDTTDYSEETSSRFADDRASAGTETADR